jgi:hypothetical protein
LEPSSSGNIQSQNRSSEPSYSPRHIDPTTPGDAMKIDQKEPKLEYSPLCGTVIRDGLSVQVRIYKFGKADSEWALEVIDPDSGSTVWRETFQSDIAAYDEFCRSVETDGIRSFAG